MKLIIIILSLFFVTSKVNSQTYGKDDNKYRICYGEMTKAHKARGYHQSNRAMSIKVKEEICKLYSDGKIDNYEGKR